MENTWKDNYGYKKLFEYRIDNMVRLLNCNNINSILDLGCGMQTLKNKLPDNIKYIGVDLYKHVPTTIVMDFNKGEFYNEKVDVIFCSGVFEYIYDLDNFCKNISKNTNIIIGSYNFLEDVPSNKRPKIWVNSYDISSFFNIWYEYGFRNIFISKARYFSNKWEVKHENDRIFVLINNNYNYESINYNTINEILIKESLEEINSNLILLNQKLLNNSVNISSNNNIEKKIDNIVNAIAWWIPVKKWRDNFRNKILRPDQTRPDQTRPDQTRPDQTRPDQTRP